MMAECASGNQKLQRFVPAVRRVAGVRSLMEVPLIADGDIIGLIDMARRTPFTASELKRVSLLASQITMVIKREMVEEALQESETRYHCSSIVLTTRCSSTG